jgi:glycosyltransferase involved in cell wall biosynthesis
VGQADGSAGWCLSDLVHALAQLPDGVSLEVESDADQLSRAQPLCRAYALGDRISLTEAVRAPSAWRFRGASATAPEWATQGQLDAGPSVTMAEMVEALWPEEGGSSPTQKDDQVLSGHRVAIVTNLPAHYRIPLFTHLSRRLDAAGALLRVFFLGASSRGRSWLSSREALQFDHEFARSVYLPVRRRRAPFLPLNLRGRLAAFDPTIILAAGFSPFSTVEAALYAQRRQVPFGIWSGEIPALAPEGRRWALRRAERRWLARRASFGVAYGSLAARYLRSLAPRLPVVIGRNTSVVEVTKPRREDDSEAIELVAVADLSVPGKGIETVVDALELSLELPCRLTVIGGRPGRGSTLEGAARDDRVRFLGPLPHDDVMATYQRSDVFLFPSRVDPFGLALVEAMASELAVIVSPAPGAVADLAVSGHNCLVAEEHTPRSWADRIGVLVADDRLRHSIARHAHQTIDRRWTIAHAVEAMTAGLRLGAQDTAGKR